MVAVRGRGDHCWVLCCARICPSAASLPCRYAEFTLIYKDIKDPKNNNIGVKYKRRTDRMPEPPAEVKHHPSSISLTKLDELIRMVRTLSARCCASLTHPKAGTRLCSGALHLGLFF